MGDWGVSDGIETAGCIGEGGRSFCSRVLLSGQIAGGGLFTLALRGGPGGAGRLSVGGEVFGSELGVEGGGGKNRQVVFSGAELSRFPRVGKCPHG